MLASEFDYQLPKELIAQRPLPKRTHSRMLVLERRNGHSKIEQFTSFPDYLNPGDCVVINDTKVVPARLYGTKVSGGGKVELLLVQQVAAGIWNALVRPARRISVGTKVRLTSSPKDSVRIRRKIDERTFEIEFSTEDVLELLYAHGQMPLPPYIHREANDHDASRYQTVYADQPGAIAAPTAGLHFDKNILQKVRDSGACIARVTLHIGLGTFSPVTVKNINDHTMHSEYYCVSNDSADMINSTISGGGAVVAIGTSVVRALESSVSREGRIQSGTGATNLFLRPPKRPKIVTNLLTNFHLPRSTLLMLVCTFAPREMVLSAYNLAIHERFRFYSYGDCLLLT